MSTRTDAPLLYALNEQYLHIENTTVFAMGMSPVAAFVCMSVLIIHPGTCLIVTVLIAMVEVSLYGLLAGPRVRLTHTTIKAKAAFDTIVLVCLILSRLPPV